MSIAPAQGKGTWFEGRPQDEIASLCVIKAEESNGKFSWLCLGNSKLQPDEKEDGRGSWSHSDPVRV